MNKEEAREYNKKYRDEHKNELREYHKKYYKAYKSERREQSRKRYFNNSNIIYNSEFYNIKLAEQNYKCAICGIKINDYVKSFSIDHDHFTNELRGLLCNKCNLTLGGIEHKAFEGVWIINALEYLLKFNSISVKQYFAELSGLRDTINQVLDAYEKGRNSTHK